IGNTSLTHDYVYFSTAQQKVVATASSVIVFFDQNGKNKQPISDGQRQQLAELESHTV
ncbi:acyl-CoA thioesterase, partial [Leucothrix sargassi]